MNFFRYRIPKTKFIYDTKKGLLELEQKLPISWHAFDEVPKFDEIPEVKALGEVRKYFQRSNATLTSYYVDYKPYMDFKDSIPPFNTKAIMIGKTHIGTFDRKYFQFNGCTSYLLAHDFVHDNFSIVATYDKKGNHRLALFIGSEVLGVNVFDNSVFITNTSKVKLPYSKNGVVVFQENDLLWIKSKMGLNLKCNLKFDVCVLEVPGKYFGKTAGLLGTINNEASDDFLSSTNVVEVSKENFVDSWTLNGGCRSGETPPELPSKDVKYFCESLFGSKMSPFSNCFSRVPVEDFLKMCLETSKEEICGVAVGYMEVCRMEKVELRIPESCVRCNLMNGTEILEGIFVEMKKEDLPMSTDVVFIVEAKECNGDLRKKKNLDTFVSILDKELSSLGFVETRYALVTFGGRGVFNEPRSIISNGEIFTSNQNFPSYFDNLPIGNGSSDIFEALNFASRLIFRPGVSKTFILLPCSNCTQSSMQNLDYAAVHQLLREYQITLHILTPGDFQFKKGSGRINKQFFGMDHEFGYSKKDSKDFKGDPDLRKQVSLNKNILSVCVPLALETNGTVFAGKKLSAGKKTAVKLFASVFGRRVAKTAVPGDCQTCECNTHDDGTTYMECFPCEYPGTSMIEDVSNT